MTDVLTKLLRDEGVLLLTLNRPRQRNALSGELIHAIAETLSAAAGDDAVRCAVITGSDGVFSAGADIKEFITDGIDALDNVGRNADWTRIERFPKPLVAAVEGFAFGGGHELMLLADVIVAAEDARFGQPEIDIGVLPGDGGTQRVTRIAGKPLAMLMIMGGEPIDAQTALAAGLVSTLVVPGTACDEAMALAKVLAAKPPVALRMAKQAVLAAYETSLAAGTVMERQAVCRAFETEDRIEGMTAFKEKRDPVFKGR
ncbi:MAG: enoyl-CoA hydratase-related protein [Alphaproteobacteria bacterium]|jgi:enoyl-CoA hydratase|nr:enoyl-CoA hydratase-related protein [Alphaproteobacteria bacterium]